MSSIFEIAKNLGIDIDSIYAKACEEARQKVYHYNFSYDVPIEKQKQDLINEIYIRMVKNEIIDHIQSAEVTHMFGRQKIN